MSSIHGRSPRVGLFLPFAERMLDGATPRWADIAAMARLAEDIGLDSLWLGDHLLIPEAEPVGPWEAWSLLSALAVATRRVTIGPLVAATSFRNPALLAKMADTLDEISGGRLVLGLGSGYVEREYQAFGYPFDHRASRFEEAVQIIRGLLRRGAIDFAGTYYQARECELRPRGPRPEGPPILVASGSPRMLRLTARYADSWNGLLAFQGSRPELVPPLRIALDAACAAEGRDAATLERTVAIAVNPSGAEVSPRSWLPSSDLAPLTGTAEELALLLREFAREGVAHLQVIACPCTLASVEALAPVLTHLDQLGPVA